MRQKKSKYVHKTSMCDREIYRLCALLISHIICASISFAQNLSIESFKTVPLDLTSRTTQVKDNNNIPCALIKIICNDEILSVQGNVVKSEEYGNEYWVYLTSGTKHIKVLTQHHKPLEFSISEQVPSGAVSQSTYQLELKSDLPPEVLYGSSNPLMPVAMAKDGEPLLPKWWNSHENGMYIGISLPTLDGETAKSSAITNAIYSYIHSSGCITQYVAEINISESEEKTQAISRGLKKGFSIKISQEYYNSQGEYFVLCAINDDNNSSNAMISDWNFNDNNSDGELSVNLAVQAKINHFPLNSSMQYCISWTDSSQQYSVNCNGKELLLNKKVEINDNISDFILSGDLGLAQLRLLTAIPLLTDTISFSAITSISNESYSSATMIRGSGNSRPINITFYDYNVKGLRFGVSERFPNVEYALNPDFNRLSYVSGLSEKYFRAYIRRMETSPDIILKKIKQWL